MIIDTASPTVFVGIARAHSWLHLEKIQGPSLDALFEGVKNCTQATRLRLKDISGIIYCEGPGSTLGLRVAALAVNTWKILFSAITIQAYNSLEIAARALQEPGIVLARCSPSGWYACKKLAHGEYSPIELHSSWETAQQSALPVWEFPHSKLSLAQKAQLPSFPYDLAALPQLLINEPSLLHVKEQATPLNLARPELAVWEGARHR